ncbi:hypothetical protein [Telmatospirillum sp.]|uniref:hypothetical protein n=1 Tax=Telmatospirillum sp. TaxID=2079197 RepID=UPI002846CE98|nr:hypothetical protein [Telmatospirillum sp.]MDR3436410.1 hypothetical protein [Telmatospirillum sp.]
MLSLKPPSTLLLSAVASVTNLNNLSLIHKSASAVAQAARDLEQPKVASQWEALARSVLQ